MPPQNILSRSKKQKALALFQQQRLPEARALYEEICRADPSDVEAWCQLAAVQGLRGAFAEAERCCRQALAVRPSAEAYYYLGNALAAQDKLDEAAVNFGKALQRRPDLAEAHCNLGDILQKQERFAEAETHYREAIRLKPGFAPAYLNLGIALQHQKKPDEAIRYLQSALRLNPGIAEAYYHLGGVLAQQHKDSEAEACFREAVRLKPDYALAHNNLGMALHARHRFEEAIACYRKAIALDPRVAGIYNNLGITLNSQGRHEQALEQYRKAIEVDPGFTDGYSNIAGILLLLGRFAEAWHHYTRRPSTRHPFPLENFPRDLEEKRILLKLDQGLGDELFFLRFVPQLKARGAWVAYCPDPRLGSMISRVEGIDRIVAPDEAPEALDFTFSVGDLPLLLGMDHVSKVPPPLPLIPVPERVETMRKKLLGLGPAPYIGVTWRAGTKGSRRILYKETPKERLAETLRGLPGTVLILQRHPQPGEIEAFREALGRPAHDLSAVNEDLEDMLALLSLVDEYVGVSNTNMHLRAGLGKTARVLVPHPPEWRWMAEGEESPWFRGFAVYRQGMDRDWNGAFERLKQDLFRSVHPA